MDVRPNLPLCGPSLNSPEGEGQCAGTTSQDNIGEGHPTARYAPAYSAKRTILTKGAGHIMLVYVISKDGQPLMPTRRFGKVRRMLRDKKARVVSRCPFVIQLLYRTAASVTQPVEVGDDAGSKHNGLSAVAIYPGDRSAEVYASEVQMRSDITKLLSTRREFRRSRRSRKTRHREPRFDNRVHSKHKGWLAPSVENKIQAHIRELEYICSILPVTKSDH